MRSETLFALLMLVATTLIVALVLMTGTPVQRRMAEGSFIAGFGLAEIFGARKPSEFWIGVAIGTFGISGLIA